jgi:hypothetical protein
VVKVEPGFSGTRDGRMRSMVLRRTARVSEVRAAMGPSTNSEASSGLTSAAPRRRGGGVLRVPTSMAPADSRPYFTPTPPGKKSMLSMSSAVSTDGPTRK